MSKHNRSALTETIRARNAHYEQKEEDRRLYRRNHPELFDENPFSEDY